MDWAGLYDNWAPSRQENDCGAVCESGQVKRGYEVDIEFNVSFEEFQTLYLEPESEEDRRSVLSPCGNPGRLVENTPHLQDNRHFLFYLVSFSRQTNYIIKFFC